MTEQDSSTSQYCSYLLRPWTTDSSNPSPWRIVLINLETGNRRGFADFEQLVRFLRQVQPGQDNFLPKERQEGIL